MSKKMSSPSQRKAEGAAEPAAARGELILQLLDVDTRCHTHIAPGPRKRIALAGVMLQPLDLSRRLCFYLSTPT